ncbi:MAG: site-specific integrase [Pseudomonadota bacterium]|nr:site-specific integrase [Pseudomonadota bacterium]
MLTDAAIKKIKPPPREQGKHDEYPDKYGLQLHVFHTGRMTWIYAYRFERKQKNLTIGRYPTVKLAEARRKRDEARQQIEQGIDPNQLKKDRKIQAQQAASLGEVITQYIANEAPKHKGARWETIRLNKIMRDFPAICAKPIGTVDQTDMIKFREARSVEVGNSSVAREMQLLGSVFRYAIRELRVIKDSPLKDVNKPKAAPHRERRVSAEEIAAICAAAKYQMGSVPFTHTQQAVWAFLFALETAMRASEIIEMTWDMVYDDYVHLPDTKNGAARNVPLLDTAKQLLQLVQGLDPIRVLTVEADVASTLFRKIRIKAGIMDMTFHDSRHEATTRIAQLLPIQDLSKVTGHKDLKMLMRYYNPTVSEIAERMRQAQQRAKQVEN